MARRCGTPDTVTQPSARPTTWISIHPADLPAALALLSRANYALTVHAARLAAETLLELDCEVVLTDRNGLHVDHGRRRQ